MSAQPLPSELARYRILAPNAGVRVSPIALGTLNFGQAWARNMGASALAKDQSFAILDEYFSQGGNFVDTANGYQAGTAEQVLGEWLVERGNRDQIVLSSKFSMSFKFDREESPIRANYAGNSIKSLRLSVKKSLEKLQTDYLDLLFVHFFDYTTSIPELMHSLNDEVRSGRVNYIGISDTPAWIVSKANEYARNHGLASFVAYQGEWSLLRRDLEREIIPMCRSEGMALMPYGVLGQGKFKTKQEIKERQAAGLDLRKFWGDAKQSDQELAVSGALESMASELGASSLGQVAVAYHLQKYPYVFPILGCRTVEQMRTNVGSLILSLPPDAIRTLEGIVPFSLGFPYDQYG
ncbi:Aldo/keto reductase [Acaromyces ingoldii]|uniref:Aldo/keto reductase n=1 Tax=Acaromyces ingoldii TaxID=215250 RepID=A0A316YKL3_9BASI|nr:Aldo/keto reductase [Acaromyces ingoldii]PWN89751.1 Aldo/keto reductase [Acaromyces ingoldii]